MPTFQPRVCYHDCSAAVDWLERAFGFQPTLVATREGKVVSAELSFGDGRLTIGGAWENVKPPAALGGANTQTIHVMVDSGLDEHCERAKAAGATIVQEPTECFTASAPIVSWTRSCICGSSGRNCERCRTKNWKRRCRG